MTKRRLWALLMLPALLCGALAAHAGAASDPLDLPSLKGKVVYVDFWASWCGPCRQSFPWMNDMQRTYGRDGLVIIAVNVDHERPDADKFLRTFAPSFRVAYDPDGALAESYHVKGMPTSFLIDRDGKVQLQHAGFRSKDAAELEGRIRALLATH